MNTSGVVLSLYVRQSGSASKVLVADGMEVDAFGVVADRRQIDEVLSIVRRLQLSGGWVEAIERWRGGDSTYAVFVSPSPENIFFGTPMSALVDDPTRIGIEMAKLSLARMGKSLSWRIVLSGNTLAERSVASAWISEVYMAGRA